MKLLRRMLIGTALGGAAIWGQAQNVVVIPATPAPAPPSVNAIPPPVQVVVAPSAGYAPYPGVYGGYYGGGYGYGVPVLPPHVIQSTPNVVYFGSPYSVWRNYYSGHAVGCYPYSRVVCFGRREAWERGYWFQHRR